MISFISALSLMLLTGCTARYLPMERDRLSISSYRLEPNRGSESVQEEYGFHLAGMPKESGKEQRMQFVSQPTNIASLNSSIRASFESIRGVIDWAVNDFERRCHGCGVHLDLEVQNAGPSNARFPYTSYNTVIVPSGLYLDLKAAKHEVGHAIRYICHGDIEHFKEEASKFNYLRSHSCKRKDGKEFSFNEGWAAFWAGQCPDNNGFSDEIEGDVAHSLRELQNRCGSSDSAMIQVLCSNRYSIHTLWEYNDAHKRMHGCSL